MNKYNSLKELYQLTRETNCMKSYHCYSKKQSKKWVWNDAPLIWYDQPYNTNKIGVTKIVIDASSII